MKNRSIWRQRYKSTRQFAEIAVAVAVICFIGFCCTMIKSSSSGVVANGGCVACKSYTLGYSRVLGYGRPDWSVAESSGYNTYLQKLTAKGYIANPELWQDFTAPIKKCNALALIDKCTGGVWASEEANDAAHWSQKHVYSLCGKGFITNKEQWLTNPEAEISQAQTLALAAKVVNNGTTELHPYETTPNDHWGRNYLNYLCDKAVISTPEAWTNFESEVSTGNFMALICKAFAAAFLKPQILVFANIIIFPTHPPQKIFIINRKQNTFINCFSDTRFIRYVRFLVFISAAVIVFFYNIQSILGADFIAYFSYTIVRTLIGTIPLVVFKADGIEDDVIVQMSAVCMSAKNVLVLTAQNLIREFLSDFVALFRRDLARLERLNKMVGKILSAAVLRSLCR